MTYSIIDDEEEEKLALCLLIPLFTARKMT